MTAVGMVALSFWQGPIDGWHYSFKESDIPHKIQVVCRCAQLKEARYAFYILEIKKKRYRYVGSGRNFSKGIKTRESLVTRPFYNDTKNGILLQEWVPVSSLKEGL
jgi:hypothetical protein